MDSLGAGPRRARRACAWAVAAVALFFVGCGEDPPPRPAPPAARPTSASLQAEALARLRGESSIPLEVSVGRDGALRFARFSVPAAAGEPVEAAFAFLERHRALYRLADPRRELVPARVVPAGAEDAQVHFAQRVGGDVVEGSWIRVHLLRGRVRSTAGNYLVRLPAQAPSALSATAAWARAAALATGPGAVQHTPRRVVWAPSLLGRAGDARPRLAWRTLLTAAPSDAARVWIDAQTGALLDRESMRHDQRPASAPVRYLISDAHSGPPPSGGNGCGWTDLAPVIDQVGPLADQDRARCPTIPGCSPSCPIPPGDCVPCPPCVTFHAEPPAEARNLAPNLRATWDYFAARFRHHGWNGWGMSANAAVIVGYSPANASYIAECATIGFSTGYDRSRDTVAHEFTHGIIAHGPRLIYAGESGALNESLADTFGVLVNRSWQYGVGGPRARCPTVNPTYSRDLAEPGRCGDPDHVLAAQSGDLRGIRRGAQTAGGAACASSGVPLGCCDRSVIAQCNGQPACVVAPSPSGCCDVTVPLTCNDQLGVHTNSSIPNQAAWLLIGELDEAAAPGERAHRGSGVRVRGVGARKARALYYQMIYGGRLGATTDFEAFRREMVEQARLFRESTSGYDDLVDLPAFTDADVCATRNAFAAVGVGAQDATCNGVDDDIESDPDGDGVGADFVNDAGARVGDNCPGAANPDQGDVDGDGVGDLCEADPDNDSITGSRDNCPLLATANSTDSDGDGVGDACDDKECEDGRGDGVPWATDNCPRVCNPPVPDASGALVQPNQDGDSRGDACDDDIDGDTLPQATDNCPRTPNFGQQDGDSDGVGDACDNCPAAANRDQADLDGDRAGDACDRDPDGDGVNTLAVPGDDCPLVPNPDQLDSDRDGLGDACDRDTFLALNSERPDEVRGAWGAAGSVARVELWACQSLACATPPCGEDPACARTNRLDGAVVRYRVTTSAATWARVVEDTGFPVVTSPDAREHVLEFTPTPDAFWRAPDGAVSARSYRVEVWTPSGRAEPPGEVVVARVFEPAAPDAGPPDAAMDVAPDAVPDATADAPPDARPDAAADAPPDAAPDGMDAAAPDATSPDVTDATAAMDSVDASPPDVTDATAAMDVTDATPDATPDGMDAPAEAGVCPVGQTACAGRCVNVYSDAAHCGGCNRPCAAGRVCASGRCATACPAPLTSCPLGDSGSACVNLGTDVANCGACGARCAAGQRCARTSLTAAQCFGASAFCAPGGAPQHQCGELCVDHLTSTTHCGGCYLRCTTSESCVDGACVLLP